MIHQKYPKLFEQGRLGKIELKNRIVMGPMGVGQASVNHEVTDNLIAFYEERAKGGVGLIITGGTSVDTVYGVSSSGAHHMSANNLNMHLPGLERLITTLHNYDTKLIVMLQHCGKETHSSLLGGKLPVSASAVKTKFGETARPLEVSEIKEIVQKFAATASIAQRAGADGVEIHAAHGYLINQFFSPRTNHRTDEYGGSLENRTRIMIEIINAIRETCGRNFTVGARMSGSEFIEGGYDLEEAVKIAKVITSAGLDYINVSAGVQESSHCNREPASFQQGWKKDLAKSIKAAVDVPVLAVNTIKRPDFAERMLEEGVCDYVVLSRPHLADPYWALKAKEGRECEIRSCLSCLACVSEVYNRRGIKCTVNPALTHELQYANPKINGAGRPVAVVGGGPGGLEAAAMLANRGFDVTLFEKSDILGGQMNLANKAPHKEKVTWTKDGFEARARAAGVKILMNTEATIENVKALNPVGVFMCCGSDVIRPMSIPGITRDTVCSVPQILMDEVNVDGQSVVVVGSGLAGMETAAFLSARGCYITIIEMADTVAPGTFFQVVDDDINQIDPDRRTILTSHKLVEVTDKGIKAENANGEIVEIIADKVVLAMGVKPKTDLVNKFREHFDNVIAVGDALSEGRILEATRDGYGRAFVFEP